MSTSKYAINCVPLQPQENKWFTGSEAWLFQIDQETKQCQQGHDKTVNLIASSHDQAESQIKDDSNVFLMTKGRDSFCQFQTKKIPELNRAQKALICNETVHPKL